MKLIGKPFSIGHFHSQNNIGHSYAIETFIFFQTVTGYLISQILKDFFIHIGPIGVGDNNYWGAFCPGADLIIQSCVIS